MKLIREAMHDDEEEDFEDFTYEEEEYPTVVDGIQDRMNTLSANEKSKLAGVKGAGLGTYYSLLDSLTDYDGDSYDELLSDEGIFRRFVQLGLIKDDELQNIELSDDQIETLMGLIGSHIKFGVNTVDGIDITNKNNSVLISSSEFFDMSDAIRKASSKPELHEHFDSVLYETIIELTASVEIDDYETAERMTVIDRAGYTHDFKRFQEKIQIHNYNKK